MFEIMFIYELYAFKYLISLVSGRAKHFITCKPYYTSLNSMTLKRPKNIYIFDFTTVWSSAIINNISTLIEKGLLLPVISIV